MHPYKILPPKSFWSSAVASKNFLEFEHVYTRKFRISATDRIVTAGSCFAQHIAKRLVKSGFNYQDYEKAPPRLPEELHSRYGYGVYSARYANVYTVKQLLQLFQRAFEDYRPQEDIWIDNGRFYDPFRPAIEPDGFASEDDFYASRRSHMDAVRQVFTQSDVLIYTLGLTEAWRSSGDGTVFPVCPGTRAGTFDPNRHEFHNYGFAENFADLSLLIEKVRAVNANLRFLLTVSPVPLTATASQDHAMVATSYSKSVLRAVAGEIAANDAGVDYFPSYELVAAPPSRASLFDPNLRTVASRGVDVVMAHFFAQHVPPASTKNAIQPEDVNGSFDPALPQHIDDIICEEALLDELAE